MSFAAALLLAAAVAQAGPADTPKEADRGAQVESARMSVTILRPAMLKHGSLAENQDGFTPRSQRQRRDGRVTYEFE